MHTCFLASFEKMSNKNKNKIGTVYSTKPDFEYEYEKVDEEIITLLPNEQKLRITFETKGRGGKQATIITGFVGQEEDAQTLAKSLKVYCGIGGSSKDNEILLQGDQRVKAKEYLLKMEYTVIGK